MKVTGKLFTASNRFSKRVKEAGGKQKMYEKKKKERERGNCCREKKRYFKFTVGPQTQFHI